jgi:tetratricopeptide (TPR) repeat protein
LIQKSLAIKENASGKDHPELTDNLITLGDIYYAQGNYAKAEPLYQRSLAMDENALGKDHLTVASDLEHLANLYSQQDNYKYAEASFQRSLAIQKKILGKGPGVGPLTTKIMSANIGDKVQCFPTRLLYQNDDLNILQ